MTDKQPDALALADHLEQFRSFPADLAAAAELRRLHAALAEPQRSDSEHMEPVAAQHRFRHPQKSMPDWSVWQPCKVAQRPAWEIDSQGYEVEYRALYTAPQPAIRQLKDKP